MAARTVRAGQTVTESTSDETGRREADAEAMFAFTRAIGDAILPAYLPILQRRRAEPYGDR